MFYAVEEVPGWYAGVYFGTMVIYLAIKGVLRFRAGKTSAQAISLIPSSLWPWRFYGVVASGDRVARFQINALTGRSIQLVEQEVLDTAFAEVLAKSPEFKLMRELSSFYHVVSAKKTKAGEILRCQDLRTRNFQTTFGDLELLLDADKNLIQTKFYV